MREWCAPLVAILLGAGAAMLPPKVDRLDPPGGQRGTDIEVTFRGQRLAEPQALLLDRPGIEVVAVAAGKDGNTCSVTLRLPADCALGPHGLRLRTSAGLSNHCLFQIGALPGVREQRKGQEPQAIELGCTVDGEIAGEETDRYVVAVPAGAHVIAEVEAMRLGRGPIDLALSVIAPDGRELARVDDTALGHKDPWLGFDAEGAGHYELRVLQSFADGVNAGQYRLHVGQLPRPVAALPCGGAPGSTFEVLLLGDTAKAMATVTLPDDGAEWFAFHPKDARGVAATPIWLRVGGPAEQVPQQDDRGRAVIAFPGSVSGVVDGVADGADGARYTFAAKKGEALDLRVLAVALRSALVPVLTIRDAAGKVLARDDGQRGGGDCALRFSAPADGDYEIVVRDLLGRGSPQHVFRLEGGPQPRAARCRMVVARGQEAALAVPRGGSAGGVLQFDDVDPDAGLRFLARDLPEGVTAVFGPITKGINLAPFVLTASGDAPLAGACVDLALRADQEPLPRAAGYLQTVPLVTVRNDQPILSATQRRLPVAVVSRAPFAVSLDAPPVPLIRGAGLLVAVRVQRSEGFAGEVRLKALWTPPGVGAGEVIVKAGADTALLPLDAGNALLGPFALAVVATATVANEGFAQGSTFVEVQVDKPWLDAKVAGVRAVAGAAAELAVTLRTERALQGPLQLRLVNLPKGVTATPVEVLAAATAGTIALVVAADAPAVRSKNVALEVSVPSDGAFVVHRFSVGELRVDAAPATATPPATGAPSDGERQR